MVDFATLSIVLGQFLLLLLLMMIVYISIQNGRRTAREQIDALQDALSGTKGEERIEVVKAIASVHHGMASRTRLMLSLAVVLLISLMVLMLTFVQRGDGELPLAVTDVLTTGSTLLFGLLATIVGFYFGGRTSAHASRAAGSAKDAVDAVIGGSVAKELDKTLVDKLGDPEVVKKLKKLLK